MATYQFFKHIENNVLIYLPADGEDFYTEKHQLLEQGFELHGDIIQAESLEEACQIAKDINCHSAEQYALSNPIVGLVYFIRGLFSRKKSLNKKSA